MSLHKLSAGDGYTYLTQQVAAVDGTDRGRSALADYYTAKGESPGVWGGAGLAGLGSVQAGDLVREDQMRALFGDGLNPEADRMQRELVEAGSSVSEAIAATRLGSAFRQFKPDQGGYRARVGRVLAGWERKNGVERGCAPEHVRGAARSAVAREMFVERYEREPVDDRELSGFQARMNRAEKQPVAGFDLTFSPVKSVSALWAVAPREVSEQIAAAHREAVDQALAFVEGQASYTRRGTNGVRKVDTRGLMWARFDHRDSRAGDPDLHTHVAISNKVQDAGDGSWLALDGQVLYRAAVAASETYNSALERGLTARLGVGWRARDLGEGKRQVREIAGVPAALCEQWSSRRVAIEDVVARLGREFRAQQGRSPSPKEMLALYQQANLETRQDKHEPRSEAEQRQVWRAQAARLLGGAGGVEQVLDAVLRRPHVGGLVPGGPEWQQLPETVVDAVTARRAVFGDTHIRAEAERQLRRFSVPEGGHGAAVDRLVSACLDRLCLRVDVESAPAPPDELRRADGTSMYEAPHSRVYTTSAVLAAEDALVEAARHTDGRRIDERAVDLALLESTANGIELNEGQARLVRSFATSGARVQLALAPAGTGKTTAMRVLARAWTASGGQIVGLAPSAVAAKVLGDDMGVGADTLAMLVWGIEHPDQMPGWAQAIGEESMLVIDEAGMASTRELDTVTRWALARGASVRLVGDDRQLAAVGAGGVLRDIDAETGSVTLTEVLRFTDPGEARASLSLREGRPEALGFYYDRGRVHSVDETSAAGEAWRAWRADRAAGRDSLLLASTTETVARLNELAQRDRLAVMGAGARPVATAADGTGLYAGDVIVTRSNDRRLHVGANDFVKNRDRWTVEAGDGGGGLVVRRIGNGQATVLPADYVARHVELGYASTVHGAQGMTVDTSHMIVDAAVSREGLYVGMTRGRVENHAWVVTVGSGDPETFSEYQNVAPETAGEVLESVLAHSGGQVSARTQAREDVQPETQLAKLEPLWSDAILAGSESHLSPEVVDSIPEIAEEVMDGLTGLPAWEPLRNLLVIVAANGNDVREQLQAARDQRRMGTVSDTARELEHDIKQVLGRAADEGATLLVEQAEQAADRAVERVEPELIRSGKWAEIRVGLVKAAERGIDVDDVARRAKDRADREAVRDAAALLWWRLGGIPAGGPLPWLPAVPSILREDPAWDDYMRRLGDGVAAAAEQVRDHALHTPAGSLPGWAQPLAGDMSLVGDLAVWRTARAVPDSDLEPVGERRAAQKLAKQWRDKLDVRVNSLLKRDRRRKEWADLLCDIDPRLGEDPFMRSFVHALVRRGAEVEQDGRLLREAAARSPLPDEHPAAALYYRVLPELGGTEPAPVISTVIRPAWIDRMSTLLGAEQTAAAAAEPGWPRLVTAVEHAARKWPGTGPEQLVDAAAALTGFTSASDMTEAVARLTWAVRDLAAPPPPDDAGLEEPPAEDEPSWDDLVALDVMASVRGGIENTPAPVAGPERSEDAGPEPVDEPGDPVPADAEPEPAPVAGTSPARIIELNNQAAAWWAAQWDGSPAQDYLRSRFGEAAEQGPWTFGWAGPGPAALTRHLLDQGADVDELVDAGLTSWRRRGQLQDVFRNRLVIGIHDQDGQLVGFTGRKLPQAHRLAPKYLNTRTTPAFTKGAVLVGLSESADELAGGAIPVRVEGPMDAIAVTLAGRGRFVGVAPMGTALTDAQAQLLAGLPAGRVMEATDRDEAGQRAVARDWWAYTGAGADSFQLVLTGAAAGVKDPADVWRLDDGMSLNKMLEASALVGLDLGGRVVVDQINQYADRLRRDHNAHLVVAAMDAIVPVLAAMPVKQREQTIRTAADHLADILGDPDEAGEYREALSDRVQGATMETPREEKPMTADQVWARRRQALSGRDAAQRAADHERAKQALDQMRRLREARNREMADETRDLRAVDEQAQELEKNMAARRQQELRDTELRQRRGPDL